MLSCILNLRISKCSYARGSRWLYVGTNKGNVRIIRVVGSLAKSRYTIPYDKVVKW